MPRYQILGCFRSPKAVTLTISALFVSILGHVEGESTRAPGRTCTGAALALLRMSASAPRVGAMLYTAADVRCGLPNRQQPRHA